MKWPFRKRHEEADNEPELRECPGLDIANAALQESLDRWPEVRARASRMRQLRHDNHFSETLERPWRVHRR